MKDQVVWRAYRITSQSDLQAVLQAYYTKTGCIPNRVRLSDRASDDLVAMVRVAIVGAAIERAKTLLPNDVWLAHDNGGGNHQPQSGEAG